MKTKDLKTYEAIYSARNESFLTKLRSEFQDLFFNAKNKDYSITVFQDKLRSIRSAEEKRIGVYNLDSQILNALELDQRLDQIHFILKCATDLNKTAYDMLNLAACLHSITIFWNEIEKKRSTYISSIEVNQSIKLSKSFIEENDGQLKNMLISPRHYTILIEELVNHEFCTSDPIKWIAFGPKKSLLCALIFSLYRKGYYKSIIAPTSKTVQRIALITFSVKISIRTIESKSSFNLLKNFDFLDKYLKSA